jgi:hypothetical protein
MFIGHFAPALIAATHKDAPRLPVLFVGAQLVDWAFFAFLLTGTEKMRFLQGISAMNPMDLYHMPYTHSLLGAAVWALGFAALVWLATKNRNGALVAAAVVLSHWFLDWLVHVPDLTIAGQPPKLGLGLWNYPMIEIPLELALIFGSLFYYARKKGAKGAPLWTIAILFAALQLFSWFGPIDQNVTTGTSLMAFAAFGVVTLAAYWLERSGLAGKRAGG